MSESLIAVGDIVKDINYGTRYRVISFYNKEIILCEMDITKLSLLHYNIAVIIELLSNGSLIIEQEAPIVFDENDLSEFIKNNFIKKRTIMNEVIKAYGPDYSGLSGKKSKPDLNEILKKYCYPHQTFWKNCVKYFQSGMKDYSLVDAKAFGVNKGKQYHYSAKPGKKSEYFDKTGIIITDEILRYFEEALKEYKSGRQKTINSAYNRMNNLHFSRTEIINGVTALTLLPESQRPTKRQLYYYFKKHLTEQEKDIIKTSAAEQRNNKRLLISDSLDGVYGPGDMVEIDACEADVSLVSSVDPNKTIGRPIVYFMIDVFTRIILAVSVAFDNNSVLGVTNLFLNLADDKKEYCCRYGMGFDNDKMWPSNIIPRRLRVDRGSEFKSNEFSRICNELGIEKQIVSGASGSLKGIVEQSFHQMHSRQNVHLEDYGLIEKRYDSEHNKEAILNIEQYTKMVINFVLMHNQQYDENYPLTKEMMDQNIEPKPAMLWQYGIQKYGQPRPIPVKEQYLYNLMTPVKAKLSRRGISYKDLWYLPLDDPKIASEMFHAGKKKVPYEVRMDMRNVGAVYYIRNGKLIVAPLNANLTGNAEYANLTMKQWEDIRKKRKQMDAEGRSYNEELSAFSYAVNESIVAEAKKESFSDNKEMRLAREIEKQMVSSENKIQDRLDNTLLVKKNESSKDNDRVDKNLPLESYASFEEAFEDFL